LPGVGGSRTGFSVDVGDPVGPAKVVVDVLTTEAFEFVVPTTELDDDRIGVNGPLPGVGGNRTGFSVEVGDPVGPATATRGVD
jgi:hypothetical protein